MRRFLLGALAPFFLMPAAASGRPNVVLILVDDMGFSDLGSYGSEIRTPALDSLAAGGVRFTQFYNGARCCPTRASMLTGLYAHQAGQGLMNVDQSATWGEGYAGGLNRRCVTMAEVLRDAGYSTYMSGKWHVVTGAETVGSNQAGWPLQRGFERFFGTLHGSANYFTGQNRHGTPLMSGNRPIATPADFYLTDAIADTAVRFLDDHYRAGAVRPFFLYTAFTAPHWPLQALKADIDRYRERYRNGWEPLRAERHARQKELGLLKPGWRLSPPDGPDWAKLPQAARDTLALKMAIYAAQVDRMDQNVGKVVAALRRHGALDSTLLVFLSDNGACAEGGDFGYGPDADLETKNGQLLSYGTGWANASNTPLALYKHYTREGGISTPLIVHWPGRVRAGGSLVHHPGHLIDLMPTFLEAAGARYPKARQGWLIQPMEGRSLVAALGGGPIARTSPLFWEHEENKAVRDGRWKLVANKAGAWRLFDMDADRTENDDLAGANPQVAASLEASWNTWADRAMVRHRPSRTPTRIEVVAPAAGERVQAGARYEVRWGATTDSLRAVRIHFQADGGAWTTLADSVPHTGAHAWSVPSGPAASARLRLESLNGKWKDTSAVFSIVSGTRTQPAAGRQAVRRTWWRDLYEANGRIPR